MKCSDKWSEDANCNYCCHRQVCRFKSTMVDGEHRVSTCPGYNKKVESSIGIPPSKYLDFIALVLSIIGIIAGVAVHNIITTGLGFFVMFISSMSLINKTDKL